MTHEQLFLSYVNSKKETHKREIGRFWSSEVYAIIKGYLKPEGFFEVKEKDFASARNIFSGLAFERQLREIMEFSFKGQTPEKKELEIGKGIVIVVKPDFQFPDKIIETKFPVTPISEIPEKYTYQLECEYRAFKLPTFLGVFKHPFDVEYFPYTPSEERWEKIQKAVKKFNKELCQLK